MRGAVAAIAFMCLMLVQNELRSQSGIESRVGKQDTVPTWLVTQTPSALFGFYPSFQVGIERRFSDRIRCELDLGLIFFQNYWRQPVNGHKARFSFKLGSIERLNLIANLHYRKTSTEDSGWNFFEEGGFEMFETYEVFKTTIGLSIGAGECYVITDRLQMEWSVSFGSGQQNRYEKGENGLKRNVVDSQREPLFDLSFKILYVLR